MAESAYSVHDIDLSATTSGPAQLVKDGLAISSITVLSLPVGASFGLSLGRGQVIPVIVQGVQFKPKPRKGPDGRCVFPSTGLFYSVTSVFAGAAQVMVTYDDDGLIEITGAGAPPVLTAPAGFMAAQQIPATAPAAPTSARPAPNARTPPGGRRGRGACG